MTDKNEKALFLDKVIVTQINDDDKKHNSTKKLMPKPPGRLRASKQTIVTPKQPKSNSNPNSRNSSTSDVNLMENEKELKKTDSNLSTRISEDAHLARSTSAEDLKSPGTLSLDKFRKTLDEANVDIIKLRKLCWGSIPAQYRPMYWPMLLGVLPSNKERREAMLDKRVQEYESFCRMHAENYPYNYTAEEMKSFKQIELDMPRTTPRANVFYHSNMERALSRILQVYSLRHPATGYVQGMNDIVIPLLFVFSTEFSEMYEDESKTSALERIDRITDEQWIIIEAKSFWCFSRVLEGIQDHYTRDQPGIQKKVYYLQQLIEQIDPSINLYLHEVGISYHMFAYLWMNCFLIRELPLRHIVRLWDTYFSEELGFALFHVYFCTAFLKHISEQVKACGAELERAIQILQHCHDIKLSDKDLEEMISQAYIYQSLYKLDHI